MHKYFMATIMVAALGAGGANAKTVIDFEEFPDFTDVVSFDSQGVTFTPVNGSLGFAVGFIGVPDWGTNGPGILCPYATGFSLDCAGEFEMAFGGPVDHLQMFVTGDDADAISLTFEGFLGDASLGTISGLVGDGDIFTAHLADLSSFGTLDRLVVTGAGGDFFGYGYDDISFNVVPEPATWAMMLAGFGAIGGAMRADRARRRALRAA